MKQLFALLPIFSTILFFTICGALNYNFGGSDESPLYKITVFFFGLLGSGVTLWAVMKKELPLSRSFWFFIVFLPVIVITLYYTEIAFNGVPQSKASSYLLMMGAFSYTSIASTIYIAEKGFNHFAKWMDVFMIIFTVAAYNAVMNSMMGGHIGVGGATYQALSYYCAFAFNINLCGILFGNQTERFPVFKTKWFGNFAYVLLLIQLTGCFLGGGRGATIYLVLNALLLLIVSKRLSRTMLTVIVFGSSLLVSAKVMQETMLSNILGKQIERAFSFIDSEGQVHGDDRFGLYGRAWDFYNEHGVMGAGLFKALTEFGNPHNLFVEMLIQGGFIYCLLWIAILLFIFYQTYKLVKKDHEYYLIPLIIYPLTMLMFSGTYPMFQQFWFFVVYIIVRYERHS